MTKNFGRCALCWLGGMLLASAWWAGPMFSVQTAGASWVAPAVVSAGLFIACVIVLLVIAIEGRD